MDFSKLVQDYPLPGERSFAIDLDDKEVTVFFLEASLVLDKRNVVSHTGKIQDIFELIQWALEAINKMGYEFESY